MGAEHSKAIEEENLRQHQQQQLRPASPQPQQQQLMQASPPQPQPQPQQQQLRPQSLPQQQQQQQQQQQKQQQQQQLLTQEGTSREAWLLPHHGEAAKPSSTNTTKQPLEDIDMVNPKRNQSLAPSVKPSKELMNLPRNYEDILKGADSPVDKSSREKLLDQLYAGVFLDHKTKKYWLDKRSNANCFMLYARALSIIWAEDQQYWKWVSQKEPSGTVTEVAELKIVCWLEVNGKFDTRKLSPGILYQVSFIVMLKDPAQGWEVPVNVRLVLPGGKKQQHKENLIEKLRVCWIEIPVGEFVASEQDAGDMEFSMYEFEGGMWKKGLVIKGVAIKPKQLS